MKAVLLVLLFTQLCHAYVFSNTEDGEKIKWKASQSMPFYVDTSNENSGGVDPDDVQAAIEDSLSRWNQTSPIKFSPVYTSSLPPAGTKATFKFSSNPAYFGSGVLAVTSVSYNNATGTIYGADILMNDSLFVSSTFTADPSYSSGPYAFIGDVIAHEVGHMLGLNHSETQGATMIYSIFKGQHKVGPDDKAGIKDLYNISEGGSIEGLIVGEREVPVFGAHVQAIELDSNKVASGVFTDGAGKFELKNLDPAKSYVLYVSPVRSKDNLPKKYSSFRSDFCDGNTFRPSFFSKCGGSSSGRAQVIRPGANVDVGMVTVKCATTIDPKYLKRKSSEFNERHVIWDYYEKYKAHETFTGHFSEKEVSEGFSGIGDRLKIDLSGVQAEVPPSAVEVSFSSQKLGTSLGLGVYARRVDQSSYQFYTFDIDPFTGRPELDFKFELPLSADADDNVFELDIYPVALSSSEQTSIFAAPQTLTNDQHFYFLSAVIKKSGSPIQEWSDVPYEDNFSCLEGNPVTTSEAYSPVTQGSGAQGQDGGFSCATVSDIGSGDGGGPGGGFFSFLIGSLLAFVLFAPRKNRLEPFV